MYMYRVASARLHAVAHATRWHAKGAWSHDIELNWFHCKQAQIRYCNNKLKSGRNRAEGGNQARPSHPEARRRIWNWKSAWMSDWRRTGTRRDAGRLLHGLLHSR